MVILPVVVVTGFGVVGVTGTETLVGAAGVRAAVVDTAVVGAAVLGAGRVVDAGLLLVVGAAVVGAAVDAGLVLLRVVVVDGAAVVLTGAAVVGGGGLATCTFTFCLPNLQWKPRPISHEK